MEVVLTVLSTLEFEVDPVGKRLETLGTTEIELVKRATSKMKTAQTEITENKIYNGESTK